MNLTQRASQAAPALLALTPVTLFTMQPAPGQEYFATVAKALSDSGPMLVGIFCIAYFAKSLLCLGIALIVLRSNASRNIPQMANRLSTDNPALYRQQTSRFYPYAAAGDPVVHPPAGQTYTVPRPDPIGLAIVQHDGGLSRRPRPWPVDHPDNGTPSAS